MIKIWFIFILSFSIGCIPIGTPGPQGDPGPAGPQGQQDPKALEVLRAKMERAFQKNYLFKSKIFKIKR